MKHILGFYVKLRVWLIQCDKSARPFKGQVHAEQTSSICMIADKLNCPLLGTPELPFLPQPSLLLNQELKTFF